MPYYSFTKNTNSTILDLIGDINRFRQNFNVKGFTGEGSIVDVLCKYQDYIRSPPTGYEYI